MTGTLYGKARSLVLLLFQLSLRGQVDQFGTHLTAHQARWMISAETLGF